MTILLLSFKPPLCILCIRNSIIPHSLWKYSKWFEFNRVFLSSRCTCTHNTILHDRFLCFQSSRLPPPSKVGLFNISRRSSVRILGVCGFFFKLWIPKLRLIPFWSHILQASLAWTIISYSCEIQLVQFLSRQTFYYSLIYHLWSGSFFHRSHSYSVPEGSVYRVPPRGSKKRHPLLSTFWVFWTLKRWISSVSTDVTSITAWEFWIIQDYYCAPTPIWAKPPTQAWILVVLVFERKNCGAVFESVHSMTDTVSRSNWVCIGFCA